MGIAPPSMTLKKDSPCQGCMPGYGKKTGESASLTLAMGSPLFVATRLKLRT